MTSSTSGSPKNASALLDQYYLDMRSALIETAAAMDRIQSAEGGAGGMEDVRIQRLRAVCAIVASEAPERARRALESLSEE